MEGEDHAHNYRLHTPWLRAVRLARSALDKKGLTHSTVDLSNDPGKADYFRDIKISELSDF